MPIQAIQAIADYMKQNGLTLVTAESCTGGLIADQLASVPGVGEVLDCAFVTYSPAAKIRCLNVRPETIARFNLTSAEVAREMAVGALNGSSANVAIANTGVTDDIDPKVPAGTQCFAWIFIDRAGRRTVYSETRRFEGDRNEIRQQSAQYALEQLCLLHADGAAATTPQSAHAPLA